MKLISVLLLLSLALSCGNEDPKKLEKLSTFRILGVVAASPEVSIGGSTTMQLYIADVEGGGRVINGTVESCVDPGISAGALPSCEGNPTKVDDTYTIDTGNEADLGPSNLFTGLATDTVTVTAPSALFLGRSTREQYNGVSMVTIFRFNLPTGPVTAFKRLTATSRSTLNSNPSITAVKAQGQEVQTHPKAGDVLSVSTNSPESYDYENLDGALEAKREDLQAAWYVSEGEINHPLVPATDSVSFKHQGTTSAMVLVVAVRDERGGIALTRRVLY